MISSVLSARDVFAHVNRWVLPAVRSGAVSPLPVGGGLVVLETTGRRTGRRREVPLVASRAGDRIAVSTVRSNSQWLRNVEAEPSVRVWLGGRARRGVARVTRGPLNLVTIQLRPDDDPIGPADVSRVGVPRRAH